MDAITLLKDDHKTVESLFKQFEKAGERAVKTKRQLADQMIKELTTHAYIEETLFYPAARKAAPDTAGHVLESIEEHHVVVWMLSELAGMDPADERFTAKVTVLIENVRHHVKEEEQDWFPQVRKAMGSKALRQLGEELAAAKSRAPSDPLKNISAGLAGSPAACPGSHGSRAGVIASYLPRRRSSRAGQGGKSASMTWQATSVSRWLAVRACSLRRGSRCPGGSSAGGLRPASPKCGVGLAVSTASNAATVRRTRSTSPVAMPRLSKREAPSVYAVLLTATTSSVLPLAWLCTLALGLEALDRLGCRGTESFEDYSDPVLRLGAPSRVAAQPLNSGPVRRIPPERRSCRLSSPSDTAACFQAWW